MPDLLSTESALSAVNDASSRARSVWLVLLSLGAYLLVTVASITHHDLLLDKDIALPILNVGLPLFSFFIVAPALFLTLHLYFLVVLYLLSRRVAVFKDLLSKQYLLEADRERVRAKLDPFIVLQQIVGDVASIVPRFLLSVAVLVTVIGAPALILLVFQLKFIPYHSEWVTWWHRTLIIADVAFLCLLWPATLHHSGRFLPAFFSPFVEVRTAYLTMSVAIDRYFSERSKMSKSERKSGKSFWGSVNFIRAEYLKLRVAGAPFQAIAYAIVCSFLVVGFSAFVATIPNGSVENWMRLSGHFNFQPKERDDSVWIVTQNFFKGEGKPDSGAFLFARNLRVVGGPTPTSPPDVLRFVGRDLRNAVFRNVDLRNADFSGALLQEATFLDSRLDQSVFHCSDTEALAGCADLTGVEFRGGSLNGASFQSASMGQSRFVDVIANGTNFDSVKMHSADFLGARLVGSSFHQAHLHETSFESHGSYPEDVTDLRGAEFIGAKLSGVDFSGADLSGVDLRGSKIHRVVPPETVSTNLDVRQAEVTGPDHAGIYWTSRARKRPDSAELSKFLAELGCFNDHNGSTSLGIIRRASRREASAFNGHLGVLAEMLFVQPCPGTAGLDVQTKVELCRSAKLWVDDFDLSACPAKEVPPE